MLRAQTVTRMAVSNRRRSVINNPTRKACHCYADLKRPHRRYTAAAATSNTTGNEWPSSTARRRPPLASTTAATTKDHRQLRQLSSSTGNNSNIEDMRYLYLSLRSFSSHMPSQLVAVNNDANNNSTDDNNTTQGGCGRLQGSWRTMNAMDKYRVIRRPTSWRSSYFGGDGHEGAAVAATATTAANDDLEDNDDSNGGSNDDEDKDTGMGGMESSNATVTTTTIEHQRIPEETPAAASTDNVEQSADAVAQTKEEEVAPPSEKETESPSLPEEDLDDIVKDLETQLIAAIRGKRTRLSMQLFETATLQHGIDLNLDIVLELYQLVTNNHPFYSYHLMQYIIKRTKCNTIIPGKDRQLSEAEQKDNDEENEASAEESEIQLADVEMAGHLYERMAISLRQLNPKYHLHGDIRSLVTAVVSELKQMNPAVHRKCLPELVNSLVAQRANNVGRWAENYYEHMAEHEYDLPPKYFQQLLVHSKYNRNADIPYHDALRQAVNGGLRPATDVVMNVVENMFPYLDNIKGTCVALQSVIELQQKSRENEGIIADLEQQLNEATDGEEYNTLEQQRQDLLPHKTYVMEISTIEYMSNAAAQKNHVEMMLLIWDALDIMSLEVTASVYENTIMCFIKNSNLVQNAFVVLKDMEDAGFAPSQALVEGAAFSLRSSGPACMESAEKLFQASLETENESDDGFTFTTTGLNIIMSAYSWKGDVDGCLRLLNASVKNGLPLDVDTFSYALESVGKATKRLVDNSNLRISPFKRQGILDGNVEASETILALFEESRDSNNNPLAPTHHFVRNYVEFLCILGEVETASMVVTDFMEQDKAGALAKLVDNKTLARVAVASAESGNFEMARKCLASMSEVLPFLEKKILRLEDEQRKRNMQIEDYSQ